MITSDAAGVADDRKGFLFFTSRGHTAIVLSEQPMTEFDAWRMVRRRGLAVGIVAPIGNYSFHAMGITVYFANGGPLEHAQEIATHELDDRTEERITPGEVERIRF